MNRVPVALATAAALTLSGCSGTSDSNSDSGEVKANNVTVGTALVAQDPGDDVTLPRKSRAVTDPVDIRRVTYTRTAAGDLEVVITAENIQGEARRPGREVYHADVYMGLEKYYAIAADKRGRITVLDVETGKVSRPGGTVDVAPQAGTVTLVVPLAALGDLPSISVGASASVVAVPNGDELAFDEAEFPLDRGV
jgi:hypothetical protein